MKNKGLYLISFVYLAIGVFLSILDVFYNINTYLIVYGIISIVVFYFIQIKLPIPRKRNIYFNFLWMFSFVMLVQFIASFFEDSNKFYLVFLVGFCVALLINFVVFTYAYLKNKIKSQKKQKEKVIQNFANNLIQVKKIKEEENNQKDN